jgi:predicted nucleic acid-binding protein
MPKCGISETSGMNDAPREPSVYIDANPFIYFIEGEDAVANRLKAVFDVLRSKPGVAATSDLTLAEVLPRARRDHRRSYLNLLVWSKIVRLLPVTREILIETADYRRAAMRKLADGRTIMPRLPDAIHVVTAIRSRCRAVLSADGRLRVPSGMVVLEPDERGIAKLMQQIT